VTVDPWAAFVVIVTATAVGTLVYYLREGLAAWRDSDDDLP